MVVLKDRLIDLYEREVKQLGEEGIIRLLDAGRKWDLSKCLKEGGSVVFPHAYLRKCGDQVAAAVHGCLDSRADQVLLLGVDHALSPAKKEARIREFDGGDLSMEPLRGVFQEAEGEFSLKPFKTLWDAEVKRRGIRPPKLIMRYPSLVNRSPETLSGIEELVRLCKSSLVIATADLNHHGLAYRDPKDRSLEIDERAKKFATTNIQESFEVLKTGDYRAFFDHCYAIKNDAKDTLSVLRFLKGPQNATILDLRLVDTAENFEGDLSPSWVATSVVELN